MTRTIVLALAMLALRLGVAHAWTGDWDVEDDPQPGALPFIIFTVVGLIVVIAIGLFINHRR